MGAGAFPKSGYPLGGPHRTRAIMAVGVLCWGRRPLFMETIGFS